MTKIEVLMNVNESLKQVSVIKFVPLDIQWIDMELISMDDATKVLIEWVKDAINNGLDMYIGRELLNQLWNVKGV